MVKRQIRLVNAPIVNENKINSFRRLHHEGWITENEFILIAIQLGYSTKDAKNMAKQNKVRWIEYEKRG